MATRTTIVHIEGIHQELADDEARTVAELTAAGAKSTEGAVYPVEDGEPRSAVDAD